MTYSVTIDYTGQGTAFEAANGSGSFTFIFDSSSATSPRAIELLLLSLGCCTAATVGRYMQQKGWSTDGLRVGLRAEFDESEKRYGAIQVDVRVAMALGEAERRTLLAVARTCRIHKTLDDFRGVEIDIAGVSPVET